MSDLLPDPADLPRARQLPGALCAAALLQSAQPLRQRLRLFEVGCGSHALWLSGHLPGARYLDTSWFEQPPLWNKVPDADLLATLLAHGIAHDSCVLLYGRNPLAAARVAQLPLYAGVRDVRLLDGGLPAWCAAALALDSGPVPPYPAQTAFGAPFPAQPGYLIGLPDARALLQ
ncbi:MAG: sulfurtransferase, partial [Sphingomonadaceae bacterium]